jgi:hypothetical protein
MISSAIEFIDRRGGPAVVARATGHKPGAVALWRHRNRLPRSAWPEILDAFPDVGLEDLKRIEAATARQAKRNAAA